MSKDNSIAFLLEEIEKSKQNIDRSTLLSKHLNEKLRTLNEDEQEDEEEDNGDEGDTEELTGLEDMTDDTSSVDDVSTDETGVEDTTELSTDTEEDEGEDISTMDTPSSSPIDPLASYTPDEEGNYHVTLSSEEIDDFLSKLPSDAQVVLVKKPTYDVSVTTPTGIDTDDDTEFEGETEFDNDMGENMEGEEESDVADIPMKENKEVEVLKKRNTLYEQKINLLQKKIKEQEALIKEGNVRMTQMKDALTEGKNVILSLRTINENLQNTMFLFGQYSLTAKEKQMVVEGFAKASTLESSKLLFEVLKDQFDSNVSLPNVPSKEDILDKKQTIVEGKDQKQDKPTTKSQFYKYV